MICSSGPLVWQYHLYISRQVPWSYLTGLQPLKLCLARAPHLRFWQPHTLTLQGSPVTKAWGRDHVSCWNQIGGPDGLWITFGAFFHLLEEQYSFIAEYSWIALSSCLPNPRSLTTLLYLIPFQSPAVQTASISVYIILQDLYPLIVRIHLWYSLQNILILYNIDQLRILYIFKFWFHFT